MEIKQGRKNSTLVCNPKLTGGESIGCKYQYNLLQKIVQPFR